MPVFSPEERREMLARRSARNRESAKRSRQKRTESLEAALKQVALLQGIVMNLLVRYEPQSIPRYFPQGVPDAAQAIINYDDGVFDAAEATDDDTNDTDGSDSPLPFFDPDMYVSDFFDSAADRASTTIPPHLDPAVLQGGRLMVVGAPLAPSLRRARPSNHSNMVGTRRRRSIWTTSPLTCIRSNYCSTLQYAG